MKLRIITKYMQSIQRYPFSKESILRPMVFTKTTRQRGSKAFIKLLIKPQFLKRIGQTVQRRTTCDITVYTSII